MPVPATDSNENDGPDWRLISMWSAAVGHYTTEPTPGAPAAEDTRMLGHYFGETLYRLAVNGLELSGPAGEREQHEFAQGVSMEWFNIVRADPNQQAMAALAVLAEMLHAAIDGLRMAGADVNDAHDLAVKLEEYLDVCAGRTGLVGDLQQMLIENARTEE
jgi:hypothetical protein